MSRPSKPCLDDCLPPLIFDRAPTRLCYAPRRKDLLCAEQSAANSAHSQTRTPSHKGARFRLGRPSRTSTLQATSSPLSQSTIRREQGVLRAFPRNDVFSSRTTKPPSTSTSTSATFLRPLSVLGLSEHHSLPDPVDRRTVHSPSPPRIAATHLPFLCHG